MDRDKKRKTSGTLQPAGCCDNGITAAIFPCCATGRHVSMKFVDDKYGGAMYSTRRDVDFRGTASMAPPPRGPEQVPALRRHRGLRLRVHRPDARAARLRARAEPPRVPAGTAWAVRALIVVQKFIII